jgi:hypothetical protein
MDAPIIYKLSNFHRAGFHDEAHNISTRYEGRPNSANNAAWDELLSGKSSSKTLQDRSNEFIVGIIEITKQENERLDNPSAMSRTNPNRFIVEVEMFHQLHCLV